MALGSRLAAETPERHFDEYQVKAALLCNFARFIDWPAEAFQKPDVPLSICVLGEDPFGRALDAGKAIRGRFLAVRRIADARLTAACHILFIGSSTGKRVLALLPAARQPGLLTVGDAGISIS
jgi:hypothetical protein